MEQSIPYFRILQSDLPKPFGRAHLLFIIVYSHKTFLISEFETEISFPFLPFKKKDSLILIFSR